MCFTDDLLACGALAWPWMAFTAAVYGIILVGGFVRDLASDEANRIFVRALCDVARGLNKLGWHWWPSDSAIATTDYEGRAKCINLGHCTPACAQGAKSSTDITYWPHAIRAGVEQMRGVTVPQFVRREVRIEACKRQIPF